MSQMLRNVHIDMARNLALAMAQHLEEVEDEQVVMDIEALRVLTSILRDAITSISVYDQAMQNRGLDHGT